MKLREKVGGVTSVLSAADAKKLGISTTITAKIEPKSTKPVQKI